MRVLAIRGKNLASLAGDFAVEFDQAPLRHTGLFAITGPTGSGKSTLLDTLCLALFDRTPRFEGGHQFRLTSHSEEDGLMSNDVRHILRRGAHEGMAQVDFTGCDGKTYRSTWRVRRARGKASGRLQTQTLSLQDLESGQELGDTRKTETLNLIREKLGLDFKQFCRSVLLAQGDFAAFIKAKPNQRAELLERMTGTEIYSKISAMAFQKTREARLNLKELEERVQRLAVLGEAERAELESQLQERNGICEETAAREEELKQQLVWRNTWERLKQDLEQAAQALTRSETDYQEAQAPMDLLKSVVSVQPLRQHLNAVDHSRHSTTEQETRVAETRGAEENARLRRAELEPVLARALEAKTKAGENAEALKPELDRARRLDGRLATLDEQLGAAVNAREEAQYRYGEADQAYLRDLDAKTELEKKLNQLAQWFEEHKHQADLVEHWTSWRAELKRFSKATAQQKQLTEQAGREKRLLEKKETGLFRLGEQKNKADEDLARAQTSAEEAREKAAAFSPAQLRTEKEDLNRRLRMAQQYRDGLRRMAERRLELEKLEEEKSRLQLEKKTLDQKTSETEAALPHSAARLEEARRALKLAEDSAGFQEKRDVLLVSGEPCPLCGSEEHPYARNEPSHFLGEQKARVQELQDTHHQLLREESGLKTQAKANGGNLERLELRITGETQKLEEDTRDQAALTERMADLPEHGEEETYLADLKEAIRQVDGRQEEAEKAAETASQWEGRVRDLAGKRDHCKEQYQTNAMEVADLSKNLKLVEADLARNTEEREAVRIQLHTVCGPGDREELDRGPETFYQICVERVDLWERRREWEREKTQKLHALERILSAAGERRQERKESLEPLVEQCRLLERDHQVLKARREKLLDGQTVDRVTRRLEDTAEQTARAVEEARAAIEGVKQDLASLQAQRRQQETGLQDARERLAREERVLEEDLQKLDLEEDHIRDLLRYNAAWIGEQQARFEKMEADIKHWRTLRSEREARLAEHQSQGDPDRNWEETAAQCEALKEQLKEARAERDKVNARLLLDDERLALKKREEAGMEGSIQETRLWETLNELIGSAEGDKFRKFAQSLTLEILVESANDHLKELEPRYQLQRVSGSDLELQIIDRYMADEPRGLNSLSGGESFLVSLALALGLSSLSVNRTQIDSLFIDEGFGSLDANTLDSALSVLDTLQASGRSVGVISHVPTVAERVGVRLCLLPAANGGSRLELQDC